MYGCSEDDRAREREIISVIGSPNGSESVSGMKSQPVAPSRAVDWFLVSYWSGIREQEALKNCEGILVQCFRVAGGMPEFQFPNPTTKKIGPFMRTLVVHLITCLLLVCFHQFLTI